MQVPGASVNMVSVIIYRPRSVNPSSLFFKELADVVERTAVYAAPLVILGDVNVWLDVPSLSTTTNFNNIIGSADLIQHIVGPMHRDGHTLNVVITPHDVTVSVTIE